MWEVVLLLKESCSTEVCPFFYSGVTDRVSKAKYLKTQNQAIGPKAVPFLGHSTHAHRPEGIHHTGVRSATSLLIAILRYGLARQLQVPFGPTQSLSQSVPSPQLTRLFFLKVFFWLF